MKNFLYEKVIFYLSIVFLFTIKATYQNILTKGNYSLDNPFNSIDDIKIQTNSDFERVFFIKTRKFLVFSDFSIEKTSLSRNNVKIESYFYMNSSKFDNFFFAFSFSNKTFSNLSNLNKTDNEKPSNTSHRLLSTSSSVKSSSSIEEEYNYTDSVIFTLVNETYIKGEEYFLSLESNKKSFLITKPTNKTNKYIISSFNCLVNLSNTSKIDGRYSSLLRINWNKTFEESFQLDFNYIKVFIGHVFNKKNKTNSIDLSEKDYINNDYDISTRSINTKLSFLNSKNLLFEEIKEINWKSFDFNHSLNIKYFSLFNSSSLPIDSFSKAIDFKSKPNIQVYLISNGKQFPNVFMYSSFTGNSSYIQGQTIILDTFDLNDVLDNGVYGGIVIGNRKISNSDIIKLEFNCKSNTFLAEDCWSSPDDKQKGVFKDSFFLERKIRPEEQHLSPFFELEYEEIGKLTTENVDNVKLINATWYVIDTNLSISFGKFKNLWEFNWEKQIPLRIDPYDWGRIKKWDVIEEAVGGSWGLGFLEKEGFEGIYFSSVTNFFDGSGYRSDLLETYGLESISVLMRVSYLVLLVVFIVFI